MNVLLVLSISELTISNPLYPMIGNKYPPSLLPSINNCIRDYSVTLCCQRLHNQTKLSIITHATVLLIFNLIY